MYTRSRMTTWLLSRGKCTSLWFVYELLYTGYIRGIQRSEKCECAQRCDYRASRGGHQAPVSCNENKVTVLVEIAEEFLDLDLPAPRIQVCRDQGNTGPKGALQHTSSKTFIHKYIARSIFSSVSTRNVFLYYNSVILRAEISGWFDVRCMIS
jgi:hypothetical protein